MSILSDKWMVIQSNNGSLISIVSVDNHNMATTIMEWRPELRDNRSRQTLAQHIVDAHNTYHYRISI